MAKGAKIKIVFIFFSIVFLSSCVTTPEEKSCVAKILSGTGYATCKEYGTKETLKEYGITDGTDCLDYALQEEKKWAGTHMSYVRSLIKVKINNANKECRAKAKEKISECQAKVDACVETSAVASP